MATEDNNIEDLKTKTPETTPSKTDTQPEQTGDDKRFTQADMDKVISERLKRADAKAEERILEAVGLDSLDTLKGVVEAKRKSDTAAMTELEKSQVLIESANQALATAQKEVAEIKAQQIADGRRGAFNEAVRAGGSNNEAHLFLLMQAEMGPMFSSAFEDGASVPDDAKMKAFIKEVQTKFPMYFGTAGAGSPSNASGVNPPSNLETIEKAEREMTGKFRI